jgi:hypothetical protein
MSTPQKLKRVVIKEEFVDLLGCPVQALVLNQFLYWADRCKDFDQFIAEEKTRRPDTHIELTHGWVYKKSSELAEEILLCKSEKTVRRAVIELVNLGFIHERANPQDKWNKTLQYRPDLLAIKQGLERIGHQLCGYKFESTPLPTNGQGKPIERHPVLPERQNDSLKGQNDGSYIRNTEITTEITSEREEKEREAPKIPLPHKMLENQFVVEKTPWMKLGDINSIDAGFVKYVQDWLKGRGAYEKKDPTEGDTKTYIRRYRIESRGSERRQELLDAITNKWESYQEQGAALNETEIDYALLREKGRLSRTDELPKAWSEYFGEGIYYAAQLTVKQKVEYLNWLRQQEAAPYAA